MTAARPFGRVDAIVHATSKLRQVWLSLIAILVSAVLSLPDAHAAPGDVDALNLNIVGSFVYASAVQPDGKTIIGGQFSSVLGQARNNIARLNADGTLDAGFNPNANGSVESVALQADGQILLGGFFTTIAGSTRNRIARVAADGTLDAGFNPNANGNVRSIAVQADGQILLGGDFTTVGGSTRNRIARVAANGTLDVGFNPNANATVYSIAIQADGQILLGGSFITIGGSTRNFIARVAANGTLDASFTPNANFDVISIAVQANGQILFVGFFTTVNGVTRDRIARLAANGTLDMGFNPVPNSNVFSIALQADGRILFGGEFTSVGGTTRNRIARVAADGMLDLGFNPNVNGDVRNITLQANGQILLGDVFTTVGGSPRNRFARLLNDPATQSLSAVDTTQVLWTRGGSAPELGQATFELSTNGGVSYTPLGGIATRVGSTANWQLTGLSLPASGQLRARGRTAGGFGNGSTGLVEQVAVFSLADITSNLQARYACDGNALDSTANARHLAADFGVASFTPMARSGSACSFSGATRLKSVSPFAFSWPVTYAFWVNDASPAAQEILMQAASFGTMSSTQNTVSIEPTSSLRVFGNNPTFPFSYRNVSPAGIFDSSWHHVAITATRFRNSIQIYIDGALASTTDTGADANFDLDGSFFLGSRSDLIVTSPENFSGKLDEIRLYDRVLAPADIAELVDPPGMGDVPDTTTNEDVATPVLNFNVFDLATVSNGMTANAVSVSATSSNLALVPNGNISLSPSGTNRTVFVFPASNESGSTTITLTATDADSVPRITTQSFELTVNPVNDAPSFVAGANQTVLEDAGLQSIPGWAMALDDGDPEAVQSLNFLIISNSNPTLFAAAPTISPTGTLSFQTNPNAIGSALLLLELQDDGGSANGGVFSTGSVALVIDVLPVNDAPNFGVGATVSPHFEDPGPQSVPGWAIALDDGDPETVQTLNFVVTPVSGTLNFSMPPTVSLAGTLSYTPAPNSFGSATFSVRLDDDGGIANGGVNQSAAQNLTINVGAVNDAPSFVVGANQTVFENAGAVSVPGWASAIDDGDPETAQTLSFVVTPLAGTVGFSVFPTVSPAGTLSYTTAPDSNGNATFSVQLDDDGGTTNGGVNQSPLQNFTVTVGSVNSAPAFVAGANQSVLEDAGAVSVPAWATALDDGDPELVQTLNFVVTPISGTVNFSVFPTVSPTGTLSYTTDIDSIGSATFSVRLDDNGGTANGGLNQSALQNFTISVGPVNDAPSFAVGAAISPHFEDPGPQSVPGWAIAVDDGDPETVQTLNFVVTPISGTLNFSMPPTVSLTGTLSYTPAPNSFGSATFSVRLDDNGGTANGGVNQSAPQNLTINVGAVNDAPTFVVGANQTTFEDIGAVSVPAWASTIEDGDPEAVQTLNFVVTPISGTVNFSVFPTVSPTGTLSYTTDIDSVGSATFSVRLDDDGGTTNGGINQSADQTFTISVGPVNDAPSFAVGAAISPHFEDPGPQSVPGWAIAVDDGDPETVQTLNFVVTPISGTLNFSMPPTVSLSGTLSYTPAPNSFGSATFSVRLDDNGGTANGGVNQSAALNFTIDVFAVNDAPTFVVGANQTTFEDIGAVTVPGWATVDDGDPEVVQTLSFEITAISGTVSLSAGPTISPSGTLSYTPAPNSFGSATITIRVNDDGGLVNGGVNQSTTQNFTISVIAVNDAPSFVAGANQNVLEDAGSVTVPGWATAIDWNDGGVVQSVTFAVTPISGTVNFSVFPTITPTGQLSYTPAPNSAGSATFAVVAMDNGGTANGGIDQSPPQNFTINVASVNDAPSFVVGANQNVLEDAGAISVPNWATALDDGDPESPQNLNFTLISNSNPTLFSAAPSISPTGALSYTSVANASGSATISLRLNDDGGTANGGINQSAPQNFTITVAPVNDVPSFVVGTNQVLPPGSNAPQAISNWASAISDGDTDFTQALSFTVTNDRNSMFSTPPAVAANGTLSFTPNGTAGRAIVSVSLTDDANAGGPALTTPVQTFSIIVRGIPTVTIEQRSPAATVVGEPFSVRVRVLNPTSSFQATGMITVALLPSGNPVQCTLAPIATPPGAAEAICNNVISPIATAKLVQASYNGDAVFALGEGLSQHPVDKAATRLTILEDLPDPSMSNSPVAVRYLLEVLPPSLSAISDVGGEIRLSYGQTDSSLTPVSSTNPIALITMQGNGSNPLTASYTGDGNFLNSTVATPEPHTLIGGNNSDLAVAISNSRRFVPIAGETIYQVRVSNLGSISSSAQLDAFVPEGLDNYRWTCSASAGSSCHAPSGNGTIVAGINILAGGNVTYTIRADVSAAEATLVRNSVRITPALSPPDANPANDTATDTDVVAVFVEGFEE